MIKKNITRIVKLTNSPFRLAICIFAFAFIVRLIFILTLEEKWYFYDTKHYDSVAQNLIRGEGFRLDYKFFNSYDYNLEPMYPLFLAANYAVFGRVFFAVRLVQAVLGAFLCVLIFWIGRYVFGKWPGIIAAAICAVYPHLIFISGLLYPEQLFTVLIALGVLFLIKFQNHQQMWYVVWASLCFGVACLTKGVLLAFLPVMSLWLLWANRKSGWRYQIKTVTIVFVVVVATLTPWTIRNYRVVGQLTPVRAHTNVILDEKYADRDDSLLTQLLNGKIGIGNFAKKYCGEFLKFWTPTLGRLKSQSEFKNIKMDIISAAATIPIMLFGILGLWFSRDKREEIVLFLCVILSFACTYAMFLTHVRYRIPVDPYIILFAGNGLFGLGRLMFRNGPGMTKFGEDIE